MDITYFLNVSNTHTEHVLHAALLIGKSEKFAHIVMNAHPKFLLKVLSVCSLILSLLDENVVVFILE